MAPITPSPGQDKTSSPTTSTPATSVSPPHAVPSPLPLRPPPGLPPPEPQNLPFNLFATKFIPKWLKDINAAPPCARIVCAPPPDTNFELYARTFLPDPLFATAPSTHLLASIQIPRYALDAPILGPQVPLQTLAPRTYSLHFRNGLIAERWALGEEFRQYNLYDVQLEGIPQQPGMYRLHVPGVREFIHPYIPGLYVGDAIIIRTRRVIPIAGPPGQILGLHDGFDGREYIVYIWHIDRLKVIFPHFSVLTRARNLSMFLYQSWTISISP